MIIPYNNTRAVEYAKRWALSRNPQYSDFSSIGGDCTNFASQCLFSGVPVMNYTPTFGWYYKSLNNRSPSWTGVDYFYDFLVRNDQSLGPFGNTISPNEIKSGDFIQLSHDWSDYHHTLIVCGFSSGVPLICAHSNDALMRPLSDYQYTSYRCIRILGARV